MMKADATIPHKKSSFGIKGKVFMYLLGFSLLLLAILWLFQTVLLGSFYKAIKRSQVQAVAARIATYIDEQDWDAVQAAVLHRGDLYVEVWSEGSSGQTIPDNLPEGLPKHLSAAQKDELFQKTRENGGLLVIEDLEISPNGGKPLRQGETPYLPPDWAMQNGGRARIQCLRLVSDPNGETQLLIVSADISPVNATVETLRVQLLCISVVTLVLAVGLALLISRGVATPIVKLNKSARQLGEGNYSADFSADGYREISELSSTLAAAAQELAKTDKLRRELIANVSHDLRTPLTLITGYSEMMRDIPGENTPENMQVIIDESKRLTSLVKDLMDLSQLESGTSAMQPQRFGFTQMVDGIIHRVRHLGEPDGYSIHFTQDAPAEVYADETRISQVVYNLLLNALNYAGPKKEITVLQQCDGGYVKLSIQDDGAGIPENQLASIWERYYRADMPHVRPVAGTGLGLSIVKGILDNMQNVSYGVESQPGQGSTFWFSLPLANAE